MQSRDVDLDPTRRAWAHGRVGAKQMAAPKSACATPHKTLRNPINQLSRDPNLDPTTYTITKIKT